MLFLDFYVDRVCFFDHVIFTVSIACGTACKAYSKDKVIADVATGWIKCEFVSEKGYEP